MGIPVLFTDTVGVGDLEVKPLSGLWPEDEVYPGEDVFPDEGPTLQLFATAPSVGAFGVEVDVDPVEVVFSATAPINNLDEVNVVVNPIAVTFSATVPDTGGQNFVVTVDTVNPVTFGAPVPDTSGGQLLILVPSVRELPPLRLHHTIVTPAGRHYRWGEDDPNPSRVPASVSFSDTMPGGFENASAVLPRRQADETRDLERLSTWTIRGVGGEVAWEGRIERASRSAGDESSVSPSAVGFQAHLDDDKSATQVYVDADMGQWRGPGVARQASLMGGSPPFNVNGPSTEADTAGSPAMGLTFSGTWTAPRVPLVEAWYDAGPSTRVAAIVFLPSYSATVNTADANWTLIAHVVDGEASGAITSGTDVFPATSAQAFFPAMPRRFGLVQWFYSGTPGGTDGVDYSAWLRQVTVVGDHGLTVRADSGSAIGVFASDVVAHAVNNFAPLLSYTTGPYGSIRQSAFVIPHLAFHDRTTAGEIVRQASRFGLQDWGVWEDRTFRFAERGTTGRRWRARVGPAQLSETGQSVDRVWNSIVVEYADVDGTTRTVGPPGSGTDTEDPALEDADPTNPANEAGIVRRDLLQMGTSTAAGAIEVGRRFLEESKVLDGSGQAQLVGHVLDDRGVLHPYWAVRSGDTVVFTDAADTSARRVVRTEKDHSSRTCSIDLDAPPQSLDALLERLDVVLVPLGVGG